jgi:hypothetical protein
VQTIARREKRAAIPWRTKINIQFSLLTSPVRLFFCNLVGRLRSARYARTSIVSAGDKKGNEPLLSQWLAQTTRVNTSRSGISIVAFRADLACPDCPGLQILLR